jgi:integrase
MRPSIYQRSSDGKWVAAQRVDKAIYGKSKIVLYGNSEEEVEEKANKLAFELQTGQYIAPSKDSLITFLNDYYDVCKTKWEPTTAELYKMYIDVHFAPYFNDMKLKDIKAITLDKFYNYKLTAEREYKIKKGGKLVPKKMPPLSNNTVIKLNKFLKAAFNYAVINDRIRKNPTDGVKLASQEKYKPTVYNEEKFLKLLEFVHGKDEEIPIILGAGCGLRRGEICGLRWKNIDFNSKIISIETTEVNFTKNIVKDPKTETSRRQLIAPDYVIDTLDLYYKSKGKPSLNEKIVTRWKPKSLSERFNEMLDRHKLDHIRLHDLRHYNAVIMLKSGIPDKVAAERLGHSNVSTLREVYQHVLKDMDTDAANKINQLISPKKSEENNSSEYVLSKEERKAMFKVI